MEPKVPIPAATYYEYMGMFLFKFETEDKPSEFGAVCLGKEYRDVYADLTKCNVPMLKVLADHLKMTNYSKLSKIDLLRAIEEHLKGMRPYDYYVYDKARDVIILYEAK